MNKLVWLGSVTMLLVVGVRMVALGFIRLINLVTLVTLITFLLFFSLNFGDWLHSVVHTLDLEEVVASRVEDAWEAMTRMLEGLVLDGA